MQTIKKVFSFVADEFKQALKDFWRPVPVVWKALREDWEKQNKEIEERRKK